MVVINWIYTLRCSMFSQISKKAQIFAGEEERGFSAELLWRYDAK